MPCLFLVSHQVPTQGIHIFPFPPTHSPNGGTTQFPICYTLNNFSQYHQSLDGFIYCPHQDLNDLFHSSFQKEDDYTVFTGIIEEIGTVSSIQRKPHALEITIKAQTVLEDVKRGDSIAVNGVCLTVSSFTKDLFVVDVIPETFKSTTLSELSSQSRVNLERAMAANGRFGGHFVSGHVDGVGVIRSVRKETNAITKKIELDPHLMKYMMIKGSVSVDGTSLTIFGMDRTSITISLIPTTQNDSLIGNKGIGDKVNIECDMLAKYTERIQTSTSNMSKEWLQEQGF